MNRKYELTWFRTFKELQTENKYLLSNQVNQKYLILFYFCEGIFLLPLLYVNHLFCYSKDSFFAFRVLLMVLQYIIYRKYKGKSKQSKYILKILSILLLTQYNKKFKLRSPIELVTAQIKSCFISTFLDLNILQQLFFLFLEMIDLFRVFSNINLISIICSAMPFIFLYVIVQERRRLSFAILDNFTKEQKGLQEIYKTMHLPVFMIDSNQNIILINKSAQEALTKENKKIKNLSEVLRKLLSQPSIKLLNDVFKKSCSQGYTISLTQKSEQQQPLYETAQVMPINSSLVYTLDFFIQEIVYKNSKCYQLTLLNFPYISEQMKNKRNEIQYMSKSASTLYQVLAQDHQKRNNLRQFGVLKEKDLEGISKIIYDCLMMKSSIRSLKFVTQDYSQEGSSDLNDFHIKNYLINIFEAFSIKLLDKVSSMNLYFDEGFPDTVYGDRENFLFIMSTILQMLQLDSLNKKFELSMKSSMYRVQFEKGGYDLSFVFHFNCSNQMVQIIKTAFTEQSRSINFETLNYTQKQLFYDLQKSKHLIKSQELFVSFDSCETNSSKNQDSIDDIGNQKKVLQIEFGFQLPQKKGLNQQTLSRDQTENVQNIPQLDLSFTRQNVNVNHYQWKAKSVSRIGPVIELKRDRTPQISPQPSLVINEEQDEELDIPSPRQSDNLSHFDKNKSIHNFDKIQETKNESETSLLDEVSEPPNSLNEQLQKITDIVQIIESSNELQESIIEIVQDILFRAQQEGKLQDINLNIYDSQNELQNISQQSLLRNIGRIGEVIDEMSGGDSEQDTEVQKYRGRRALKKKTSLLDDSSLDSLNISSHSKQKWIHHKRMRLQQAKLLSPQVMKSFQSDSLREYANKRGKQGSNVSLKIVTPEIESRDG